MNKYAVLIGINDYFNLGDLQYAVPDARGFAESLQRNYGFKPEEITVMTSDAASKSLRPANRASVKSQLDRVRDIFLTRKEPLDLLIFGFWGHGLWSKDADGQESRFLCPMDLNEEYEYFLDTALPLADVQRKLSSIPAKDTWLVLDCCQNVLGGARGEGAVMPEQEQKSLELLARDIVLRRKDTFSSAESVRDFGYLGGSTLIFNSCSKGQKAYEWPEKGHGLFTYYLLEAMNKRPISAAEVYKYSAKAMPTASVSVKQTPFSTSEGGLDIQLPAVRGANVKFGDVFISYRHANAPLVTPIEAELQRRGISYFIDREGIDYGGRYADILTEAIDRCKTLLFVWTNEANSSRDMENELVLAVQKGKTVLPYRVGTFSPTVGRFAYHLAAISRYEVHESTPATVGELVRRIEQSLKGTVVDPPKDSVEKQSSSVVETKPGLGPEKPSIPIVEDLAEQYYREMKAKQDVADQEAEAKRLAKERFERDMEAKRKAGTRKTIIANGVEFAFRWCPAGTFMMGSPESEKGREPFLGGGKETQHRVTLTKGFWMMETQVTQKQWQAVMGSNPSHFKGDDLPVEKVSWNDCQEFCNKCKGLGLPVQLPTETQWEYACRAGTTGPYAGNLDAMAWYSGTTAWLGFFMLFIGKTYPVGTKKANAWGLYDMHGNVEEWCNDSYEDEMTSNSVTDPQGPESGSHRVCRGGGWVNSAQGCRSAYRCGYEQWSHCIDRGCRLSLDQ